MKTLAFIIAVGGIIELTILLFALPVKQINSKNDLENLFPNQHVSFSGKVIDESYYSNSKKIIFDNGLEVFCKNCPSYLNKNVSVLAFINNYNNKISLNLIKIKEINFR